MGGSGESGRGDLPEREVIENVMHAVVQVVAPRRDFWAIWLQPGPVQAP